MGKCKNCANWRQWETVMIDKSSWGGCKVLNDRKLIYPEIADDVYINSDEDFGCIKFKKNM